ncbi:Protein ELYS [Halotydeus destructor]|nr:Protein ELYS [Halotydeus destructor]
MRELAPSFIGKAKRLRSPLSNLENIAASEIEGGRISSRGDFVWLFRGSVLNAFTSGKRPRLLGSVTFSKLFNDADLTITAVKELRDHLSTTDPSWNPFCMAVILNRSRSRNLGSIVCVVDVRLSKLVKTIECPFRVSEVTPVSLSSNSKRLASSSVLATELQAMHGILALGSEGGLVVLVDLCLDQEVDVIFPPNKLTYIPRPSSVNVKYDLKEKRQNALIHGQHLGVQVNPSSQNKTKFYYRTMGGDVLSTFGSKDVYISALQFVPETNCLCVGFNFGGFQFWDLKTVNLDCSCGLDMGLQPVINFSFMEPENDPKNFCYLMIVRGTAIEEDPVNSTKRYCDKQGPAVATLYSLHYNTKDWIPDYGILYSEFDTCACRFEYNLTCFPHMPTVENCMTSQLINCYTIRQGSSWAKKSADDESLVDNSLCLFAWEAASDATETSSSFFAIFDLNQYYLAQMPSEYSPTEASHWCPYMGIYSLSDITNALTSDFILDIHVLPKSVAKFRSKFNHDLHYFPASLSFNVSVISESAQITARFLGIQRSVLKQISSSGVKCIVDPKDTLKSCIQNGLLCEAIVSSSISAQRDALLSLMLEADETSFIVQIASYVTSGKLNHLGCDVKFISDWIWKQVSTIKASSDQLSLPLFDYSNQQLDPSSVKLLRSYEVDLRSLSIFLFALTETSSQHYQQELSLRFEVTQLISGYLRMMLWLLSCGLLPESEESDMIGESQIFYPFSALTENYTEKRRELKALTSQLTSEYDIMVIDGFLEHLPAVSELWKQSGGTGHYPPPSVHSLLNVYLLDSITLEEKHKIMLYFLLDMTYYYEQKRPEVAERIKLFPPTFCLNPSLTKYVQGVWAIDNGFHDFALSLLLIPGVQKSHLISQQTEDPYDVAIKEFCRTRVINSLLIQDRNDEACRFGLASGLDLTAVQSFKRDPKATETLLDQSIKSASGWDTEKRKSRLSKEFRDILEPTPVKKTPRPKSSTPISWKPEHTPASILKPRNSVRAASPLSVASTSSKISSKSGKLRFDVPKGDENSNDSYVTESQEPSLLDVAPLDIEMEVIAEETVDFTFSPPTEHPVVTPQDEDVEMRAETPTNPPDYVFSPPVTRSRSQRKSVKPKATELASPLTNEKVEHTTPPKQKASRKKGSARKH